MIHVLLRFYKQAEQRIKDATLVSLGLTRLLARDSHPSEAPQISRCSKAAATEMKIRTACVAINNFLIILYLLAYLL